MNDFDTIAAVSTPPGEGGIGIVRLSGKQAKKIGLKMFVQKKKCSSLFADVKKFLPGPRQLYYGFILDQQGKKVDEVLFSFMPAPNSYTCEDVVEINAHGSAVSLKKILKLALDNGARLAEPGEFTKRAYLNGRLDLVQAESVISIIRAKTEKALQAALNSLQGGFSQEIAELSGAIIALLGQIEAEVDFSHEDPDLDPEIEKNMAKKIEEMLTKMKALLARRFQGKVLQEGLKTVIVGRPNVGKSSLYNYLLREERAIVTEIPGTTRDLLIEYVNIQGIPLKLIDTAGLHATQNEVEKIGIEISCKATEEADLLLFIIDASQKITVEDHWIYQNVYKDRKIKPGMIIVLNKIDLDQKTAGPAVKELYPGHLVKEISLKTGKGLEQLEEAIGEMVFSGEAVAGESALILESRQEDLLGKAILSLEEAFENLVANFPVDLISIDLRQAHHYLRALVGENAGEEILEHIFQRFCIGK